MVSWKQGHKKEREFFEKNQIWNIGDPDRRGTQNLTDALSQLLAEQIRKRFILSLLVLMFSLPTLKNSLDTLRGTIQNRQDELPPSFAHDPQTKLLELCGEFLSKIHNSVSGEQELGLFQWLKDHFRKLKEELQSTRPKFDFPATNRNDANDTNGTKLYFCYLNNL